MDTKNPPRNAEAVRVIEALGGTMAVSRLCKVKPPSVSEWKRHGIPSAREQFLRLYRPSAFSKTRSSS